MVKKEKARSSSFCLGHRKGDIHLKHIKSIKGLFGQLIHYRDGKYVGESWPGLFTGSYEHFDADKGYAGYSDPGIVAGLVHHDEHGAYVGETHAGLFGQKHHYGVDGYVGSSWDDMLSENTDLIGNREADKDIFDRGSADDIDIGGW